MSMKNTVSKLGIAVACSALLAAPVAAQGPGSPTEGPTAEQHGGSGQTPTDQQGSTHADQIGSEDDNDATGQRTTGTTGDTNRNGRAMERRADREAEADARSAGDDRTFVTKAAAGSMAEVRFGHLAADKASNEKVKQFAQRMIEDHAKLNEDLMDVARELQLTAPHAMKPEDQQAYERMSKLSGAEFDRAFVHHMVQDHRKDLQMFRQKAERADNDRVRQFAQSKLPVLEQHYQQAQQLQQIVGRGQGQGATGTTGTSGTSGTDNDRVYQGDEDQHRNETHVHEDGQGGPEEQPGTSTGTPPQ
jgi:putative membrane protein